MENVRKIALEVLLHIEKEGTPCNQAVRQTLDKYAYLSGQERAFLSRLINGTLERKIELDYIIDRFNRTGKRLKPVVAEILRLSVYQLLYLYALPDRAAVN